MPPDHARRRGEALAFTRGFALDPDFAPFVREARARGDEVMVVSEGFDFYLADQLARAGLADVPFAANRLRFEPGGARDARVPLGRRRLRRLRQLQGPARARAGARAASRTVLVGDGLSDRCGARAADGSSRAASCWRGAVARASRPAPFRDFAERGGAFARRCGATERPGYTDGHADRLRSLRLAVPARAAGRRERLAVPPAGARAGRRRRCAPRWSRRTGWCAAARRRSILAFVPEERPIGVQLFGSDPGVMAEAARRAVRLPAGAARLDRHQHGLPGAQGGDPRGGRGAAADLPRSRPSCAAWRRPARCR